jgi:dipeptidyl aminopeptidase/acylaminoacyl peptidase
MLSDQVVHETIDGETVVINLASGNYYSMEGSAADLWERLLAGETPAESAAALSAVHGGDAAAVRAVIAAFHRELFDQGVLIRQPEGFGSTGGDLGTFEIPHVQVYDDLSAHLLADPVHDVERETGWPAVSRQQ